MTKTAFIPNFLKLYNMIWCFGLPFLAKSRRLAPGFEKRKAFSHFSRADIWIHAASAGEAYLAVTLVRQLRPVTPLKILLTTSTAQGMDILQSEPARAMEGKQLDLTIEWFPFDMPRIMKPAIDIINPKIMVLLETEIWPGLFYYLKKNRTKIMILNARMSKTSFRRYLKTNFLWKHLAPDLILAVSEQDRKKYRQVFKTSQVKTMTNIKFESIETEIQDSSENVEQIRKLLPKDLPLTILASVRQQEEKQVGHIIRTILNRFPAQIIAVFPRHMNRLNAWKKHFISWNLPFYLRSGLCAPIKEPGIILWDIFGELKSAYGLASAVFVGGSLKPLGGQNFIEPAVLGAQTVTGPYYDDFAWVGKEFFITGLVHREKDWKSVASSLVDALNTPAPKDIKNRLQDYINSQKGGSRQACDEILKAFFI